MSLEHENLSVAWHLPQPSTALLRGTSTELVARRGLAIRMELETDEGVETWTLSFQGVRFFSVAYDGARGVDDLAACRGRSLALMLPSSRHGTRTDPR